MINLTINRRGILFGLLVLTLGLSKSWLQTAENYGQANLSAEAAPAVVQQGSAPTKMKRTVVDDKSKKSKTVNLTIEYDSSQKAPVTRPVERNGVQVMDTNMEPVTMAVIHCDDCGTAIASIQVKNLGDFAQIERDILAEV